MAVSATLPNKKDRDLVMKYTLHKPVLKRDQKRYASLRRIIIDKRNEELMQRNKERAARGQDPSPLYEYDKPFDK